MNSLDALPTLHRELYKLLLYTVKKKKKKKNAARVPCCTLR
jgi:hypothetical protein